MKSAQQTPQQLRQYLIEHARQVQVEGVADTVAVGYVREFAGRVSWLVFYGKQSKPAKHFGAATVAEAEQHIQEALVTAASVASAKQLSRQQARAPYHEHAQDGIVHRTYTTAGTAQLVREALKAAFPGVKFSVTSDTYAGGSSVRVAYTDGPSSRQVEQVCNQFKCGHYDSLNESYEYHRPAAVVNEAGQLTRTSYGAKYLSTSRSFSPAYGFFLNALDLRERPSLGEQFRAFFAWHSRQRYQMQTSWGEQAGCYSLSSDSSYGDLEQFAQALTVQGYAPDLSRESEHLTLTVTSREAAPAATPALGPAPAPSPADEQTAAEFETAERYWLSQAAQQDTTDQEYEAAERFWLQA